MVARQERAIRKRRQRKLKKLEQRQERLDRKTGHFQSPPGQRIYALPGRIKPLSLFIRMGELDSEQAFIPQEFYDPDMSQDEDEGHTPHPAALATRSLFHLGEPAGENRTFTPAEEGQHAQNGGRTPSGSHRPFSVQFPLQSAMRRRSDDGSARRRPKSLRFLDPRDMKTYEAGPHASKDPLAEQSGGESGPASLRQSMGKLHLSSEGGQADFDDRRSLPGDLASTETPPQRDPVPNAASPNSSRP